MTIQATPTTLSPVDLITMNGNAFQVTLPSPQGEYAILTGWSFPDALRLARAFVEGRMTRTFEDEYMGGWVVTHTTPEADRDHQLLLEAYQLYASLRMRHPALARRAYHRCIRRQSNQL